MAWKMILVLAFAVGALAQKDLEDLCKKNGAEDKEASVQSAIEKFVLCVKRYPSLKKLREDITEAVSNGTSRDVIRDYCSSSSALKTCIDDVYTGITPCMPPTTRSKFPAAAKAALDIVDFICYEQGSRVVSFLAEGGLECYDAKFGDLGDCAEALMDKMPREFAFRLNFFEAGCYLEEEWSNCVLNVMRTCPSPTIANMTETILRYVRLANACTA